MASPPSLFGQASSFSSNLVLLEPVETNAWWSNFQLELIRATRKLSVVERQRAHHDLLGVQRFSFVDDSRERIATSLQMMTAELNSIKDKPAYDKAIAINKQYVTDDTFRTRFLRAQLFNPQEAAKKMVSYFETKLYLFGEEKLTKDLKYGDLSIEARAELEGGSSEGTSLQILPSCDLLQGRQVVLVIPSRNWKGSAVHQAWWYILTTLLEDENTQRRGFVLVSSFMGYFSYCSPSDQEKRKFMKGINMTKSFPLRVTSFHMCHSNSSHILGPMEWAFDSFVSLFVRIPVHVHRGQHTECLSKLNKAGVPVVTSLVSRQGSNPMLMTRQMGNVGSEQNSIAAANTDKAEPNLHPSSNDVLLGRGAPFNKHSGNKQFYEILNNHYEEYNRCQNRFKGKTTIAEKIVRIIHKNSGRFLKKDRLTGTWKEVSDAEARGKVSHGFRRVREVLSRKKASSATDEGCNNDETSSIKNASLSSDDDNDDDRSSSERNQETKSSKMTPSDS